MPTLPSRATTVSQQRSKKSAVPHLLPMLLEFRRDAQPNHLQLHWAECQGICMEVVHGQNPGGHAASLHHREWVYSSTTMRPIRMLRILLATKPDCTGLTLQDMVGGGLDPRTHWASVNIHNGPECESLSPPPPAIPPSRIRILGVNPPPKKPSTCTSNPS